MTRFLRAFAAAYIISYIISAPPVGAQQTPLVAAQVSKSGKLAIFGVTGSVAAANGQYPLATISAVPSNPTISVNGQVVTIGPPIWTSNMKDTAFVAYQITPPVNPGDTVTYTAAAGWLTPLSGGTWNGTTWTGGAAMTALPAVTGAPMANWSGQTEGATGGFPGFAGPKTMLAGANLGEQPVSVSSPSFTGQNRYLQGGGWSVLEQSQGAITKSPIGDPITWTSPATTILNKLVYSAFYGNGLDNNGSPNYTGQWTLQYTDPSVNTAAALPLYLTSTNPGSKVTTTVQPWSLSGPCVGSPNGVVVDPRDITMTSGGGLAGVTLNYTPRGAGYQGAMAVISSPSTNWQAVASVQVTTGSLSGVTVLVPGLFGSKPTVTIYGTQVQGTTVTTIADVEYVASPVNWAIGLTIQGAAPAGANGLGNWTVSNINVVAPDLVTKKALPVEGPLATDRNVLRALSGVAALRFMDVTQGYQGTSNFIYPSDLIPASQDNWQTYSTNTTVNFTTCRYLNTNPASTTYTYASPKVYGPQAYFAQGPDGFGNFITLPPTDNGWFLNNNYGSQGWVVFELASPAAHGLTTGQYVTLSGSGVVPFTGVGNWAPGANAMTVFVTGPNTIAGTCYAGGSAPAQAAPQTVNSTTPVTIPNGGWTVGLKVPYNNANSVPYDYAIQMVSQMPGTALWLNIPYAATDQLVQALAAKVIGQLGAGHQVYLECGNEWWNGGNTSNMYGRGVSSLIGYLPAATPVAGYAAAATGNALSPPIGAQVLIAAHAYDVFQAEWVAAGLDPAQLHRVFGSWWAGTGTTQTILTYAQRWGVQVDHIAVAPYLSVAGGPSIAAAFATMPVDGINDYLRHWMTGRVTHQLYWQGHLAPVLAFKQPSPSLAPTTLITYEGSMQNPIPGSVPNATALMQDCYAHPSARDVTSSWYMFCQQGGASLAMYYQIYSGATYPNMWVLSRSTAQPPGSGIGNLFATPQGGLPGDGMCHDNVNPSPALQGMLDWCLSASP